MNKPIDVALIGGGIMSATLGTLLKQLEPTWNIQIFERLSEVALESSNPWNNAGTGHSALCELNYTPEREDGSIDISSAGSNAGQAQGAVASSGRGVVAFLQASGGGFELVAMPVTCGM